MKNLNTILQDYVEQGLLPNVVAGVASSEGTTYLESFGLKSLDANDPMAKDTIISIASMTKAVTTVAALQLVEKNHIDLDIPINAYLPEASDLEILQGFDSENRPLLRKAEAIPTVRQLLTHTSGYVYEIWNENANRHVADGGIDSLFTDGGNGMSAPLSFPPGERWEYGIGIDWAGKIVEEVSGKSLDVYFYDHIFSLIGMVDTFYKVPEEKESRRAAIHARGENGLMVIPYLREPISGGGGLNSTVTDYLLFLRTLLNRGSLNGASMLQPKTVDMMFENQIGELNVPPGKTRMPDISNDFDMGFGSEAKWGLGFLLHQNNLESGRPKGSASWAGVFNSYYWIDRDNDLCAVIATQVLPFYDSNAISMMQDFESGIYKSL